MRPVFPNGHGDGTLLAAPKGILPVPETETQLLCTMVPTVGLADFHRDSLGQRIADHGPRERNHDRMVRWPSSYSEQPELPPSRPCQEAAVAANTSQPANKQRSEFLRRSKAIKRRKTTDESSCNGGAAEPSLEEILDLYHCRDEPCEDSLQSSNKPARPITSASLGGALRQSIDLQTEVEPCVGDVSSRPSQGPAPQGRAQPKALSRDVSTVLDLKNQSKVPLILLHNMLTPRNLVFRKLTIKHCGREPVWVLQPSDAASGFDQNLTPDEANELVEALEKHPDLLLRESAWLKVCDMCRIPRYRGLLGRSLESPLSFHRQQAELSSLPKPTHRSQDVSNDDARHLDSFFRLGSTPCCSRTICERCYTHAVTESIAVDFWHDLDAQHWLRCPFRTCRLRLPSSPGIELTGKLDQVPVADSKMKMMIHQIVAQLARASRLRGALHALEPQPGSASVHRAADLYAQLRRQGRVLDLADFRQTVSVKLEVLPVDSADGSETLPVPIFVDRIVTAPDARDCIVCAETFADVTDGTPEEEARWAAAISGFPGDWTHLIRPFMPPSSLPACGAAHALDVCRDCLARHLAAQLESLGRAVAESSLGLTCPSLGCGHVYTDSELRVIATPETFARYDKLRLLAYLSTLPDFRWCLGEGCSSGQVYEFPADPVLPGFSADLDRPLLQRRNRVVCEECGFAMCFVHQTPWHEGLDCIEYDAEAGDPQLDATRAWIRDNTKACPGCQAPVEKGAGCFHMTCRVCGGEFCWECLADWKEIVSLNPTTYVRKYRRDKHAVGCYFRSGSAPEATMLMGHTVQQALGR
ncbi:hypothetical protein B0T16DRAFT_423575 [Cercophora newfieldiana]|uniref:RBR-type E3 ubiquitin transferase n=1 Tax=Cercophora newfieldiana TaxID=92897 RepID=A0AA39XT01_9PEZI|nr:hypothetical protein B0T16DRAFT_423575 [Cercophora newfieldiana]